MCLSIFQFAVRIWNIAFGSPNYVVEPARPGSFPVGKLLAGLALLVRFYEVGLQRHPTVVSGRLPQPPASPTGTAARAGKASSALPR